MKQLRASLVRNLSFLLMTSFLFFLMTIITTLGACAVHAYIHEKSCNQTCISFVNCSEVPLKSELALFFSISQCTLSNFVQSI